jgi:uncharacterized oxidoreductase
VDGRWSFGQIGAARACDIAARLANRHGVGSVALHNVIHIGRLGEYAEALARRGYLALILVSNGGPDNPVAPFSGRDRVFGTNPMAFGAPSPLKRDTLVVDFATSATAEGKLALARSRRARVEPGVLVDANGHPTTDPATFYSGGALLPFGSHKGYGLLVTIEVLARLMTGYVDRRQRSYFRQAGNATLVLAWSLRSLAERRSFGHQMRRLFDAVRTSRPAKGATQVLMPGDIERRVEAERRAKGVPISASLLNELRDLSR